MSLTDITQLAIKRHDIDASHFQDTYSKPNEKLGHRETVFLYGRKLALDELSLILEKLPKALKYSMWAVAPHILPIG